MERKDLLYDFISLSFIEYLLCAVQYRRTGDTDDKEGLGSAEIPGHGG